MNLLPVLLLLFGFAAPVFADTPAVKAPPQPPKPQGYNAFKFIRTVNIFDPERHALPSFQDEVRQPASTEASKQNRPASFVLTGTMIAGDRSLAFFAGSEAALNKVIGPGEQISGYTLKAISSTDIALEKEGKKALMVVGQQMTIDGTISTPTSPVTPAPSTSRPPSPGNADNPPGSAGASADVPPQSATPGNSNPSDLLKKLMERRQKELSQ